MFDNLKQFLKGKKLNEKYFGISEESRGHLDQKFIFCYHYREIWPDLKWRQRGGDIVGSFNTERCSQFSTFDKMMVGRHTMKERLIEKYGKEKRKEQRTACLHISWAFVNDFRDH
jgi:hypothetical protein